MRAVAVMTLADGRQLAFEFLIVPDRAGYGGSTYDRTRTVASSARDQLDQIIESVTPRQE
jgi:hypothetical protein